MYDWSQLLLYSVCVNVLANVVVLRGKLKQEVGSTLYIDYIERLIRFLLKPLAGTLLILTKQVNGIWWDTGKICEVCLCMWTVLQKLFIMTNRKHLRGEHTLRSASTSGGKTCGSHCVTDWGRCLHLKDIFILISGLLELLSLLKKTNEAVLKGTGL